MPGPAAVTAFAGLATAMKPYGVAGLAVVAFTGLLYVGETQVLEGEREILSAIHAQSERITELRTLAAQHDAQSTIRANRIESELRRITSELNAICINAATGAEQVARCLEATDR